jgi:hypothetical protein
LDAHKKFGSFRVDTLKCATLDRVSFPWSVSLLNVLRVFFVVALNLDRTWNQGYVLASLATLRWSTRTVTRIAVLCRITSPVSAITVHTLASYVLVMTRVVDVGELSISQDHVLVAEPVLQPVLQPVLHVRQERSWDCGLACVVMVLHAFSISNVSVSDVCKACNTKSVWTVDLAHLLAAYGCSVIFYTMTVGANPEFATELFYRGQLSADRVRVDRLFSQAVQRGINIRQKSLTWQDLRDHLQGGHRLAIVLIDKWKLKENSQCCCGLVVPGYAGHYIVVSTFCEGSQMFLVHDPACSLTCTYMSAPSLDRARMSFGTDEDVLLVSRSMVAGSEHSTLCDN